MSDKRDARYVRIAALVAVGGLAMFFWDSPVLLPLKLLVVLFHELGHGMAAVLTGGEVLSIQVTADQGGMAMTRGGSRFVVLSAGYLGSLLWGAALLFLGKRPRRARVSAYVLSLFLLGVAVAFVPWVSVGFALSALAALGIAALARWARPEITAFTLRGLGVFSVLYALWDIRDDILRWGQPTGEHLSDAAALAELTHIPAMCWGVGWILAGVAILVVLRKQIL